MELQHVRTTQYRARLLQYGGAMQGSALCVYCIANQRYIGACNEPYVHV